MMFLKEKEKNPNLVRVKKSKKQETRIASSIGAKRLPASGAKKSGKFSIHSMRADLQSGSLHIEQKSTVKDTFIVKREWFDKVSDGALNTLKHPAVILTYCIGQNTSDWIGIERKDWDIITDKARYVNTVTICINSDRNQVSIPYNDLKMIENKSTDTLWQSFTMSWESRSGSIWNDWVFIPLSCMSAIIKKMDVF